MLIEIWEQDIHKNNEVASNITFSTDTKCNLTNLKKPSQFTIEATYREFQQKTNL